MLSWFGWCSSSKQPLVHLLVAMPSSTSTKQSTMRVSPQDPATTVKAGPVEVEYTLHGIGASDAGHRDVFPHSPKKHPEL